MVIITLLQIPRGHGDGLNGQITLDELRKAINSTKCGKAIGVDNVPNEILKNVNLLNALHSLYQYCFENDVVPDMWYT